MEDKYKVVLKSAKEWLEKYEKDILPLVKNNIIYKPATTAYLFNEAENLALFMICLGRKDATTEEKAVNLQLATAHEQIISNLNEQNEKYADFYENIGESLAEVADEDDIPIEGYKS